MGSQHQPSGDVEHGRMMSVSVGSKRAACAIASFWSHLATASWAAACERAALEHGASGVALVGGGTSGAHALAAPKSIAHFSLASHVMLLPRSNRRAADPVATMLAARRAE